MIMVSYRFGRYARSCFLSIVAVVGCEAEGPDSALPSSPPQQVATAGLLSLESGVDPGETLPASGNGAGTIALPGDYTLPWGSGPGQAGIIPPQPERLASGPLSLSTDRDGSLWILDPVNGRIAHVSPTGQWLGALPCPPAATDLTVGPDGRLYVLSLVNHQVTVLDAGATVATMALPLTMVHVTAIVVNDRGHVLLVDDYQGTYDLGRSDIRMAWPSLLSTRRDGIAAASGGPRVKALLNGGRAELVFPANDGRRSEEQPEPAGRRLALEETEGIASVVVIDSHPDGEVVVLLEWFQGDRVVRTLRLVDADGLAVDEIVLGPPPLAFPFREFTVAPGGVVLQLDSRPDGLHINTFNLGGSR